MTESLTINIDSAGRLRFVWADEARELLALGHSMIERASHVEPMADCRWTADLAPIDGPLLGPFDSRSEALAAEVAAVEWWLLDSPTFSAASSDHFRRDT